MGWGGAQAWILCRQQRHPPQTHGAERAAGNTGHGLPPPLPDNTAQQRTAAHSAAAQRAHVLGHVVDRVEHGVHGVDVGKVHQLAVGQLARLVKLA